MNRIRNKTVDENLLDSQLELVLHEKAHCITGLYDHHSTHGNDFYVVKKKGLRDNLLDYISKNKIDIVKDINEIVHKLPDQPHLYDPSKLASLILKYNGKK